MESQGIRAITEDDGRVFPETELSESVIMALMPETSRIIKGREAVSAVKNRGLFEVTLDDGQNGDAGNSDRLLSRMLPSIQWQRV